MIKHIVLSAFVLAFCGCIVSPSSTIHYIDNPTNVSKMQNSTVALVMGDNEAQGSTANTIGQENFAYCTGFFIDVNTVVTANHCTVDEETESHIQTFKVATYGFYQDDRHLTNYRLFHLAGYSEVDDVAVLRLDPHQARFAHQSMCMSTEEPHAGQRVYAIGNPVGEYFVLTEGIISRDSFDEDGAHWVSATADIYFGNSGGPLVDNNGCAIGVAHSIAARQSHLGQWAAIRSVVKLVQTLVRLHARL
jgi:S1-C subfamily serine protease